jgi:hypothetical protein
MKPLNLDEVCEYANSNIVHFHERRLASLEGLKLDRLLKKNPYLFKAKHITTAGELIEGCWRLISPPRRKSTLVT